MTDTPQLEGAGETAFDSVDPIAEAAQAFKVSLGQADPVERPRDEHGRFTSARVEGSETEVAEDEAEEAEEAVTDDDAEIVETDEAAEEAQPEAVEMPASWAKEDAEIWSELSPKAQAKIAEREGQRDTAINLKFQEAANIKKANEAVIEEAKTNRTRYAEAVDTVLSLVQPQRPPISMLNPQSSDYDPDAYHMAVAQYEQASSIVEALKAQRSELSAQEAKEASDAEKAAYEEVEAKARPAFIAAYPEVTDAAKAGQFFNGLVEFAVERGVPVSTFEHGLQSVTSAEWHILADAMKYRELQKAKARVVETKPEPRKAQPAVRPGVTTPRAAVEQARKAKDFQRLDREGSIEAGAAVFKHFFK